MSTIIAIVGSDDLMHPVPVGVILPPAPGRARFLVGHDYERMLCLDFLNTQVEYKDFPLTWGEAVRLLSGMSQVTVGYHVVDADPLDLDVNDVFEHYITQGSKEPYGVPAAPET